MNSVAGWGAASRGLGAAGRDRLNFIIYQPDEMRAESLGSYGHPVTQTPNFDRLCREGVRFDHCHVQNTVCTPSRCSFFTGQYVHVAGHRNLVHMLRPHEPHLLRYLHENGYEVRLYGKNDLLAPEYFPASVDKAKEHAARNARTRNPWPFDDPRFYSFLLGPGGNRYDHFDWTDVEAGIEFLHSRPAKPFMLFLPLTKPHPEYSAPDGFHDMYDPESLPPLRPPDTRGKPGYFDGIRRTRNLDKLDEKFFRQVNAVYCGMITFTDWMFGRLLAALDETGLAANTVIIVTSDHGDYAGDWGLVEKWPNALEDPLTRVPLIIRMPGGAQGHVVKEPVEVFDTMATVLELAGIKARHPHFARSLVPQLKGAAGDPARAVFSEGGFDRHEPHCFDNYDSVRNGDKTHLYYPKIHLEQTQPETVSRAVMLRTLEYKLIHRPGEVSELYDLKKDPRELRNLHGEPAYAQVRAQLERQLLDWYVRTADAVPFERHPRNTPEFNMA